MRKITLIIMYLFLSIFCYGQTLDSIKIHDLLQGNWVDTIDHTHFMYWNINRFTLTSSYRIDEATEDPGAPAQNSYSITKTKCFNDTLEPNRTGHYLQITSNYRNELNSCYAITSITSEKLILRYRQDKGIYYRVYKKMLP